MLAMHYQGAAAQLYIVMSRQLHADSRQICLKKLFQFQIGNVASRNQESFVRLTPHHERIHKIGVFGDHRSLFACGNLDDLLISCAVTVGKIQRMNGIVPRLAQEENQAARKLGIDEEIHASIRSRRLTWLNRVAKARAARMSSRSRSS